MDNNPFITSFIWKIENFSLWKDVSRSDFFYLNYKNQKIELYLEWSPVGSLGWFNQSHVFVHLGANSKNIFNEKQKILSSLNLKYRLIVLDVNQEDSLISQDFQCQFDFNHLGLSRYANSSQWNISRDLLLEHQHKLLPNDTFTIRCEVETLDLARVNQILLNSLSEDLISMLHEEKFTDIETKVFQKKTDSVEKCNDINDSAMVAQQSKSFRVHKLVLAARSPVFGAMFSHPDNKEALEGVVTITDISPVVFQMFLSYLYSGKLDLTLPITNDSEQRFIDNVHLTCELLAVADKYQVDLLKTELQRQMVLFLGEANVVPFLLVADRHQATVLKSACIDYVIDHANQIVSSQHWPLISNETKLISELFVELAKKEQ